MGASRCTGGDSWANLAASLGRGQRQVMSDSGSALQRLSELVTSYSYENVLARGYAVIRDSAGVPVMTAGETKPGMAIDIGNVAQGEYSVQCAANGIGQAACTGAGTQQQLVVFDGFAGLCSHPPTVAVDLADTGIEA